MLILGHMMAFLILPAEIITVKGDVYEGEAGPGCQGLLLLGCRVSLLWFL